MLRADAQKQHALRISTDCNGAQRTNKEDRARTEGAELSKKYIAEEAKAHCKDFSS